MKGRPILVEFRGEPMPLSEVGRLIGVSPRAMANRYEAGKRGAELFAPPDDRYRRRGRWQVGDIANMRSLCDMAAHAAQIRLVEENSQLQHPQTA